MEKITLYCLYLLLNTNAIFRNNKRSITTAILSCALLLAFNTQAQTTIGDYDFESGTQGWTLGSKAKLKDEPDFSCDGDVSLMVEKKSIITSPSLDLNTYSSVTISFCFKGDGVKSGDGFDLKYNDGSSWATLKSYERGTDFTDVGKSNSYNFSFTLLDTSYNFPVNAQFRFESTTKKICYFDNILVEGTLASFDGDSDGDGVLDSVDIDDDNDGIKDTDEGLTLDSDGDTIPNLLDLDSDNDGIPDIVEAGFGTVSSGTATIPLGSFTDTNNNGMHDAFENTSPLDSDNDGAPNYIDLDSDNDANFDVDESRTKRYIFGKLTFENGDGDINGDGVGNGVDSEAFREKDDDNDGIIEYFGDGILDKYDYGTGANEYGNLSQGSAPYYVNNADTADTPDYIDLDSNNDGVFDIAETHYAHLDGNNDGIIDDTLDRDGDGLVDLFDTNDNGFGSPRDLEGKLDLSFDGRNDYVEDTNVMSGWSEASIMAWIKIDPAGTGDQIIIGQNNFCIQLNSENRIMAKASSSGSIVVQGNVLPTNQWTHVAATYSNTNSKLILYVNGEELDASNISGSLDSDSSNLTLGKQPGANLKYYKGYLDEARVFFKALTQNELQKMIYQEIEDNGGVIKGAIIPNDIADLVDETTSVPLVWTNLKRYYRMDAFKDNVLDDLTTPGIDEGSGARMYNTKVIAQQSAPLPFVTQQSGRLEVAVNDPVKGINGDDAINNASAIVKIQHNNVYIDSNLKQVGLIIDKQDVGLNPIEFKVQNNSELNISWYLKLDGKIDLEGESQLVQGEESYLDPTSTGSLKKNQQGTADTYTYNYWSMPVGVTNNSTNNNNYTLPDVFDVNFLTSGYNGSASPVGIADYWIWKYNNRQSNNYSQWQHVRSTGTLKPGEGFTMKGPGTGSILTPQNYVLEGKPNNGDINLPINTGNDYLVGNPYASAIDAHKFILDNGATILGTGATTGSLYFWEHWGGGSHYLGDYQGGYATYTLAGGVPAAAYGTNNPEVGTGGSPTKIPGRYIPVGQGFFVTAEADGLVNFNNSQRVFQVEDGTNSVFTKSANTKNNKSASDNAENKDTRLKLRIGFNSVNTIRRQLLVTVDENTSTSFDWGYDAPYIDDQMDDMYWMIDEKKYAIQAIHYIDQSTIIPIGIHVKSNGINSIALDKLENEVDELTVYLHDKDLEVYHDLKESNYEVTLNAGEYLNRFEITFSQSQSLGIEDSFKEPIQAYYSNEKNSIIIQNSNASLIESIEMFNILGQSLLKLNINSSNNHLEYNASQFSTGAYIIKLKTDNGMISTKKVLVE